MKVPTQAFSFILVRNHLVVCKWRGQFSNMLISEVSFNYLKQNLRLIFLGGFWNYVLVGLLRKTEMTLILVVELSD